MINICPIKLIINNIKLKDIYVIFYKNLKKLVKYPNVIEYFMGQMTSEIFDIEMFIKYIFEVIVELYNEDYTKYYLHEKLSEIFRMKVSVKYFWQFIVKCYNIEVSKNIINMYYPEHNISFFRNLILDYPNYGDKYMIYFMENYEAINLYNVYIHIETLCNKSLEKSIIYVFEKYFIENINKLDDNNINEFFNFIEIVIKKYPLLFTTYMNIIEEMIYKNINYLIDFYEILRNDLEEKYFKKCYEYYEILKKQNDIDYYNMFKLDKLASKYNNVYVIKMIKSYVNHKSLEDNTSLYNILLENGDIEYVYEKSCIKPISIKLCDKYKWNNLIKIITNNNINYSLGGLSKQIRIKNINDIDSIISIIEILENNGIPLNKILIEFMEYNYPYFNDLAKYITNRGINISDFDLWKSISFSIQKENIYSNDKLYHHNYELYQYDDRIYKAYDCNFSWFRSNIETIKKIFDIMQFEKKINIKWIFSCIYLDYSVLTYLLNKLKEMNKNNELYLNITENISININIPIDISFDMNSIKLINNILDELHTYINKNVKILCNLKINVLYNSNQSIRLLYYTINPIFDPNNFIDYDNKTKQLIKTITKLTYVDKLLGLLPNEILFQIYYYCL